MRSVSHPLHTWCCRPSPSSGAQHPHRCLLDPPLAHAQPDAGYIQAYPPGVRESGGQYNHAAVWALMASAQQGDADRAWRLFEAVCPAHRSADPQLRLQFALEPYAMAGDIYSQPPWAGRGGWSGYTGAASWLQRAALESLCGLHLAGGVLTLPPCVPPHWPRVDLLLQRNGRRHRISLLRDEAALRALLAQGPALQVRRGQAITLAELPADCAFLLPLDDPAGAVNRPPSQAGSASTAAAFRRPA